MTDLVTAAPDFADIDDTNMSGNPHIGDLVELRYSRRQTLLGGMSAAATALFGGVLVTACGSDNEAPTVQAGQSLATNSGRMVTLMGTAMDDGSVAPGVAWSQTSGPAVTLLGTGGTVRFVAPAVATSTALGFRFTALDTGGKTATADTMVTIAPAELGFIAVSKSLADRVAVPAGYSVTVLFALGDPIAASVSAYANNGTDTNLAQRAGDHHDGIYYFGLAATGTAPDRNNSSRGLLAMNHENITQRYLHPNGATNTAGVRPEAEAIKEMDAHGVAVIEVTRAANDGAWSYVQASALNRRITPSTPMQFNGPVRGNAAVRTAFSPDGTSGRGTLNNCAHGFAPWGTYLTCEENWAGYFRRRAATDDVQRSARERTAFARYGVGAGPLGGGAYQWFSVQPADPANTIYRRLTAEVTAAAATADFRNEPNQFGWVVEIDPYDPTSVPRKRTALGRMAHEGAWPANFVAGRRPVYYMGDDSRGE